MSEHPTKLDAGLPEGDYEVAFVYKPTFPVGKNIDEYVRLDEPVWVWHIKPVPGHPHGHQLSLVNAPQYTGERGDYVVVTTNISEDRVWYIYEWRGKYVIATQHTWPSPVWTASSPDPGSKVAIVPYTPNKPENAENQLLILTKLPK